MDRPKSNCRCGHEFIDHVQVAYSKAGIYADYECRVTLIKIQEDTYYNIIDMCPCKIYVPIDNLEYLEAKHEGRC